MFSKINSIIGPCVVMLPSARKKREALPEQKNELRGLVSVDQQKHGEFVIKVSHSGKARAYNLTQCPLDIYLNRGKITTAQHLAGNTLYEAFTAAGLITGLKSCLNVSLAPGGGAPKSFVDYQHYAIYRDAVEAIHRNARKMTVMVCCHGDWLKDINSTIPIYRRIESLKEGLDDLTRHYKKSI